jgi:hypothetical protein
MTSARAALRALLPFVLYGLAREVDAAVGILLRTTLDLPGFVREALSLVDPAAALRAVLISTATGAAAWLALAALRARCARTPLPAALEEEARGFDALYLGPALTLLALGSLALRPAYPYALTLPVALTQDWAPAADIAAAAAMVAWRRPRVRLPAPGAVSVGFLAFLAYALLTPEPARWWQNHPGNEPKTLRMAVAAGHWLTFDTERVSTGMEELEVKPLGTAVADAARAAAREGGRLAAALLPGGAGVGADAIRATRVTRQVVRGKDGGIYTVLAPGPSLLLAAPLRLDRSLNLRHGTPGRIALTVLSWNALAAALVAALFLLLREATGRDGLAAAVAGLFALLPPFLFYSFQFYPEMLGALALAVLLRWLLFVPRWTLRTCAAMGLLLATLPWLHQKFLPVWLVLAAMAVILAVHRLMRLSALGAILVPQALSALLVALYNFAVTGSVRPDALYLAWGPRGVTSARLGQGLLGLLLDARYGLLPYVPLLLLCFAGLALRQPAAARLRLALPAVLAYYVTVASADNWSGAVCNLGRYIMPAVPWMAALLAVVLARTGGRRGVLALVLMAAGWSAVLAHRLWLDPHAANDCALLLAGADVADGAVYLPGLFIRTWAEGAPGLFARVAAWIALAAALALWIRRVAARGGGDAPFRVLVAVTAVALGAALLLERWPGPRRAPRFDDALEIEAGTTAFVSGAARVEDGQAVAGSGEVVLLVRQRTPRASVRLTFEGEGLLRVPGHAPVLLLGRAVEVDVPLPVLRRLTGRRGVEETLARQTIEVETAAGVRLRPPPPPATSGAGAS